jgi:hypothetical protein
MSAPCDVEWPAPNPCPFTAKERVPDEHGIGGWILRFEHYGKYKKQLPLPGIESWLSSM